jgi:hypothetical protein
MDTTKPSGELLEDLKRVTGKQNLLFALAEATLADPDGIVRDVVFPVVGEQTLQDLVKEWKATGPTYRLTLRAVIRNSYRGHYRRMVPRLLAALEFRSNNERHRPVMEALDLVKHFAESKVRTFPSDAEVPRDGVVRGLWREAVVEQDAAGQDRVNRITYEIAVLEALRERLRCKEIWVVGANRYRNPDEDLPADFERNRQGYYEALELPLDAERFVAQLQTEMREALSVLDAGLKKNPAVRLSAKSGGWITLTPLDAQPDPPNLAAFKAELNATWPMTSLLDMVKETDLRLGFTDVLKSPTAYETPERAVLQPRLLLCLHGIGTNAGLQRMASLDSGTTAKDLAYVRRRYLNVEVMRRAIAIIADGTLHARNPAIWGSGTTACASDSKHFGAWDQNLTTQWHVRYGGRGVMIYWHVERNSLCIHSQLKSPSSSEVASMIEGVLHHCTEMEVDRQYVDSHGHTVKWTLRTGTAAVVVPSKERHPPRRTVHGCSAHPIRRQSASCRATRFIWHTHPHRIRVSAPSSGTGFLAQYPYRLRSRLTALLAVPIGARAELGRVPPATCLGFIGESTYDTKSSTGPALVTHVSDSRGWQTGYSLSTDDDQSDTGGRINVLRIPHRIRPARPTKSDREVC